MRHIIAICLLMLIGTSLRAADSEVKRYAYDQPVLISPAGQSAEGFMIRTICRRLGIDVRYTPQATADSMNGAKTLLLVAGGSSKGLGAAKVNEEDEMNRINSIVKAAKKANMKIVTFHIGGKARRGPLSDGFNGVAAEGAELIVVKKPGDDDQFFKKIADKNKATYKSIDQAAETMTILKEMFMDPLPAKAK